MSSPAEFPPTRALASDSISSAIPEKKKKRNRKKTKKAAVTGSQPPSGVSTPLDSDVEMRDGHESESEMEVVIILDEEAKGPISSASPPAAASTVTSTPLSNPKASHSSLNETNTFSDGVKAASPLKPALHYALPSRPRSPSPEVQSLDFFVDEAPAQVKKLKLWHSATEPSSSASVSISTTNNDGLSLPENVIVLKSNLSGHDEAIIDSEAQADADLEFEALGAIEFLDGEEGVGNIQRYFDPTIEGVEEGSHINKSIVCANCKQRGHMSRDCKVVVCLTCGEVNSHGTRSCPLALICFSCGARGHRRGDCPAPKSRSAYRGYDEPLCDRCGSFSHPSNNCPTLWRIYSYLEEGERSLEQAAREAVGDGEQPQGTSPDEVDGVIALGWDEEEGWEGWCYNCSQEGHFGDDCTFQRVSQSRLDSSSAFSLFNASNSPFADLYNLPTTSISKSSKRRKIDRSSSKRDNFGESDQARDYNVGRKGKEKERERARKYAAQFADDDDDDDWFSRGARGAGGAGGAGGGGGSNNRRGNDRASDSNWKRKEDRDDRSGSGPGRYGGSGTQFEEEYQAHFSHPHSGPSKRRQDSYGYQIPDDSRSGRSDSRRERPSDKWAEEDRRREQERNRRDPSSSGRSSSSISSSRREKQKEKGLMYANEPRSLDGASLSIKGAASSSTNLNTPSASSKNDKREPIKFSFSSSKSKSTSSGPNSSPRPVLNYNSPQFAQGKNSLLGRISVGREGSPRAGSPLSREVPQNSGSSKKGGGQRYHGGY